MKFLLSFIILMAFSVAVLADQLTHRFANPSFIGGDANKGVVLLNEANAQNGYKAPVIPSATQTPLQLFASKVQTAILSALSTAEAKAINASYIDANGYIIPNVTVPLSGGYTLSTSSPDSSGNMTITISDGISNTVFSVPYLVAP